MARIFVSHSRHDQQMVDFFSRVAAGTNVNLRLMEFEAMVGGTVSAATIRREIEDARAVFVLLSRNVCELPHTRDWVVWETGVASNKDVWVFEQASSQGSVNVVTPFLREYVVFEPIDAWFALVRKIIESYDDSHVLSTMLLGSGIGAILGKGQGAVAGAGIGALLSDRSGTRPKGMGINCSQCSSTYGVTLPQGQLSFRCPVCNGILGFETPPGMLGVPL